MSDVTCIADVKNELGEGCIWDDRVGLLRWVDIEGRALYCLDPTTREIARVSTPVRFGSIALHAEGGLVAAAENAYMAVDPDMSFSRILCELPDVPEGVRLNDGRVDRQGRFWAGTMVESGEPERGAVYCLGPGNSCESRISGFRIPNSIAWSPDGRTMYFADSPTQTIWAYKFDPVTGNTRERQDFAKTELSVAPDGSTVDAEGYLWNAQWGGSRVVRYAPDGSIDRTIHLPVTQPTCVAFGGPRMMTLFITSARQGLSDMALRNQPLAGGVFAMETDVAGLLEERFTG